MKKIKKLLAEILAFACLLSASILPSFAGTYNLLKYDIDDESFFLYSIAPAYPFSDEQPKEKVLFIYGFSESFIDDVDEFVIPDEISGEKIENVVIRDYYFLNKVVLSDGIKRFACQMELYDEDGHKIDSREENPIKSLHLGREFLAEGLDGCKTKLGRLENLETITISEENPYLASHKNVVYSKDFSTVIYCPPNIDQSVLTLKKETKVIDIGAFANNRNIEKIKRIKQVEKIGILGFYRSKKIKKITLGKKIEQISDGMFKESKLKEFVIGKNVKQIGQNAFTKSAIKEIVIPAGVKEIGSEAFSYNSKLRKVTIKGRLKFIKKGHVFNGCKRIKFYVKNKARAKDLKSYCNRERKKGFLANGAKIYVGKKLHYTIKKK